MFESDLGEDYTHMRYLFPILIESITSKSQDEIENRKDKIAELQQSIRKYIAMQYGNLFK